MIVAVRTRNRPPYAATAGRIGRSCNGLFGGREQRHGQPEFARVAAQQFHGGLDRNRIGRQAEHRGKREQAVVPTLSLSQVPGVEGLDQADHVPGTRLPDRDHAASADRQKRQRRTVVAAEHGQVSGVMICRPDPSSRSYLAIVIVGVRPNE